MLTRTLTDREKWICGYLDKMRGTLEALHPMRFVQEAIEVILDGVERNATIFICGNGGSAAMANHFAIDINKCANDGTPDLGLRCHSLAANVSEITAWGNDCHFNAIFEYQLVRLAKPGDVLFVVSTSGSSKNVVLAAEHARAQGMTVLALTSQRAELAAGRVATVLDHCNFALVVPSDHYGIVEDCHSIALHAIAYAFAEGHAFNMIKLQPVINQELKTREP